MRIALIIIWSFLKKFDVLGLISFYLLVFRNRLSDVIHDRPIAIAKFLRFVPLIFAFIIIVMITRYGTLRSPIAALTVCFMIALAVLLTIVTMSVTFLHGSLLVPFMSALRSIGLRAAIFFIPSYVVCYWFRGNSVLQLMAMGVCLVLWFVFSGILEYLVDSLQWQKRRRLKRLDIGSDRYHLNDEEYWRVCVHEAGHLLLYGQLNAVPEDAIAVVDREPKYGFGGFVTPIHSLDPIDATTDILLWQTTMSYAGAAAERLVFGSHCEGASQDYEMADNFIVRLARLSPNTQYFTKTENPTQEAANIMAICRLRSECQQRADEYLTLNRMQLIFIAEQLRDKECVTCEEFSPVWRTLLLPAEWKRLTVPARIPCLDLDG
ncbi:peptidase M41-like protein [Collimonas sp. PA-H2]|uniref:hypothetical protein n=1 Tax=Collimonas sp. PA-H2 TaxID=1881062 RepID=UPI000BF4E0C5|nr:hypothetical protein [Collimonas sp. PA-H2]PFH08800.1 peptidase M41-like protein [Collimonas sp. PA-H2]